MWSPVFTKYYRGLWKYTWAASSENVPLSMRQMRSFSWFCACAKDNPGLRSRFLHSVVSSDSVSGQWKPWSDCTDVQADMGLRCPHMREDTFSHGTAHITQTLSIMSMLITIYTVWHSSSCCQTHQQVVKLTCSVLGHVCKESIGLDTRGRISANLYSGDVTSCFSSCTLNRF